MNSSDNIEDYYNYQTFPTFDVSSTNDSFFNPAQYSV